jgi:hypothetical protein
MNMQSKGKYNKVCGVFCHFIFSRRENGTVYMVPDIVRLKYKYELYTSRYLEDVKIQMRAMSYLIMIGDIK